MRVPYRRALITLLTKELLTNCSANLSTLSGVDTVGLRCSWRCSTLFLAAIARVRWSPAASGRFGTRAVELGVVPGAAAIAIVREMGNGRNHIDNRRVC